MVGRTSYDYSGESAIVTGSTKGIGRGIAEGLADAGANVVINARTEEDVERTVEELQSESDGTIVGVAADIGDPSGIEKLVSKAVEEVGPINLHVNNAAVWPREGSMVDATMEDWNYTMNVNVRAQFYASKLVAQHMIENGVDGSIVNHTSQTGDRRAGGRGLYGISKTSINGLTWRMAHDLAEHGIRMNAISTDMTESYQLRYEAEMYADEDAGETAEDVLQRWAESEPLGRLGQPSDIADAVLFLASDRASYVTGTILRVSGGGNLQ
jgi:NAD(P)-dependent dehydrogenase (short-subunit alcohol dehydrogenase family)